MVVTPIDTRGQAKGPKGIPKRSGSHPSQNQKRSEVEGGLRAQNPQEHPPSFRHGLSLTHLKGKTLRRPPGGHAGAMIDGGRYQHSLGCPDS